jgi:ketosteroid isomerase-like protein
LMRCAGFNAEGVREDLDFRLTVGLVRRSGRWLIAHEHHSIPAA